MVKVLKHRMMVILIMNILLKIEDKDEANTIILKILYLKDN